MPDILVREVPAEVVDILKKIAKQNRRSLQQELLLIFEKAARRESQSAAEVANAIRKQLSECGRTFSDSTEIIRKDRER